MKKNLPVTNQEKPYPKGQYLVSKTDLKGAITYCNETFIELSGFSKEELKGQNHNIVRHPDMPPAAFADLWRTVKAGYPWQGIVKNRCKDGDHYWVKAYVVPITKGSERVGYMSVRTEASRPEIQQAEALYQTLNQTGASLNTSPPWYQRISLATRLWSTLGFVSLMIVLGTAALLQQTPAGNGQFGIIGGALLTLAVLLGGGTSVLGSVQRRLKQITHHFRLMSQGDLTDEINTQQRDEAGNVLTELAIMQVSLKVMLDEIQAASRRIEEQSRKVEWQSANVVDQSEQQRDKAASVAAATEEFTQSVRSVSDAAGDTSAAAQTAQVQVSTAQASMDKSMAATGRVVDAVHQSSETIQTLNQAIAKIGDITNVIREIADQTNLLALNAAIEAARAGEAGRGFAVVADEVRKLAERTATSTQDISANVAEIKSVTDTAVASMDDAVQEVEAGIGLIRESGAGLTQITESSRHVTDLAHEIASSASEQVIASDLIAQNMERVVQLVDGNLEAANLAREAVHSLTETASYLNRIANRFKVIR